MQVTADCIDPQFTQPVIDSETDETSPVPHHRVSGHFEGTNIQFNIYLHAQADKAKWDGRFFQYTYPTAFGGPSTALASDRAIGFALASGGYAVAAGNTSVSLGYRHDAAAAKFAKTVAATLLRQRPTDLRLPLRAERRLVPDRRCRREHRRVSGRDSSRWFRACPAFQLQLRRARSAAELILGTKAAQIRDAVLPGGRRNPYATLDAAERAMLKEMLALGIPLKAWEDPDYLLGLDPAFYGAGLDSDTPARVRPHLRRRLLERRRLSRRREQSAR